MRFPRLVACALTALVSLIPLAHAGEVTDLLNLGDRVKAENMVFDPDVNLHYIAINADATAVTLSRTPTRDGMRPAAGTPTSASPQIVLQKGEVQTIFVKRECRDSICRGFSLAVIFDKRISDGRIYLRSVVIVDPAKSDGS